MSRPTCCGRLSILFGSLVALAAVTAAGVVLGSDHTPVAVWRFGTGREHLNPFETVPMSDPVTLEISLPFDAWVYSVYLSPGKGCHALFPSDYLQTNLHNPLPAGTHRLPGRTNGRELKWTVPYCKKQTVTYVLVVSKEPLPDLHERMRTFFQIGNTAFADTSFGTYVPRGGKAVLPGPDNIPHPILKHAACQGNSLVNGRMLEMKDRPGVFIQATHVVPETQPRRGS